ncbi:MAG: nuclear transport factor 2 family protein [Sphingobium sp.]
MQHIPQPSRLSPEFIADFLTAFTSMIRRADQAALDRLGRFYAPDVSFTDPAAALEGWDAVGRTYSQFASAEMIDFTVFNVAVDGATLIVRWNFQMRSGGGFEGYAEHDTGNQTVSINGISTLIFGDDNRAIFHEDCWASVPAAYRAHLRDAAQDVAA